MPRCRFSSGPERTEITASPEIFIAAAAQRTRHIRLGTGVTSLSYHNPLRVAGRMVMLDQLTRGRVMLGVGPGSLPADSAMIGLDPTGTRERRPPGSRRGPARRDHPHDEQVPRRGGPQGLTVEMG